MMPLHCLVINLCACFVQWVHSILFHPQRHSERSLIWADFLEKRDKIHCPVLVMCCRNMVKLRTHSPAIKHHFLTDFKVSFWASCANLALSEKAEIFSFGSQTSELFGNAEVCPLFFSCGWNPIRFLQKRSCLCQNSLISGIPASQGETSKDRLIANPGKNCESVMKPNQTWLYQSLLLRPIYVS